MLFFRLLCVLPALAAGDPLPEPAAQWSAADLFPESASFPEKVELSLVVLESSGWTMDQVKADATEAAQVLSQCGVQLAKVRAWKVQGPNGNFSFEKGIASTAPGTLRGLAQKFAQIPRPAAFFVKDVFWPGSKPDGSGTPFSHANFQDSSDPPLPGELVNTVWMPALANAPDYYELHCKSTSYSVFAHELTHVLSATGGHNNDPEPNILSLCMSRKRNNKITAKQCAQILASPLLGK